MIRVNKNAWVIIATCLLLAVTLYPLASSDKRAETKSGVQQASPPLQEIRAVSAETQSPAEPGGDPSAAVINKHDTDVWQTVDGFFDTSTNEPLILDKTDLAVVYVLRNELLHAAYGSAPKALFKWDAASQARSWRAGKAMLIGAQLKGDDPSRRGEWIGLELSELEANYYYVRLLHYGPEQALQVKINPNPAMVWIAFDRQDGNAQFDEYMFDPAERKLDNVQFKYSGEPSDQHNFEKFYAGKPERRDLPGTLENTKSLPGAVYSFADDGGALVYDVPSGKTYRYAGQEVVDFFPVRDEDGKDRLLAHLRDTEGRESMSEPISYEILPYEPRLRQGEWTMFRFGAFYRIGSSSIDTVTFHYDWKNMQYSRISSSYALHEGSTSFKDKTGAKLTYRQDDRDLNLSLYDLLNYVPYTNSAAKSGADPGIARTSIDDMWILPLPQGMITGREQSEPHDGQEEKKQVQLPDLSELNAYPNTNAEIPSAMQSKVDEKFNSGSGDGNASQIYRKFGDSWFFLYGQQLYEYVDGELTMIGTMPVGMTFWETNYISWFGPQDYIRTGSYWYVTDTVGNRLLKLDDKLRIVEEFAVQAPSRVRAIGANKIEVTGLDGRFVLNDQLKHLSANPIGYAQVDKDRLTSREISSYDIGTYYEDKQTGLIWYIDGDLVQYSPSTGKYRTFSIGKLNNGYGKVRLLPHGNEIAVLFDNRLYLFSRGDGNWLKTIEFPRVEPDGIYDMTTSGENSFYWGENTSTVYLVQGFQIYSVDVRSGEVATLFRQNYANIGPIAYDGGKLYFTLQPNIEDKFSSDDPKSERVTEHVILDLKIGKPTRYAASGF